MESIYKKYLCKYCGENNYENFIEGRYSTCKKCRYKMKNKSADMKKMEIMEPKNFKDQFNSFLLNDRTLFDGFSHFQIINEMREEIELLKSRIVILELEDDKNKREIDIVRKYLTKTDLLNESKLNDD